MTDDSFVWRLCGFKTYDGCISRGLFNAQVFRK